MRTDKKIIIEKLEDLKKRLYKKYPPCHWKHSEVFIAFWQLFETLRKELIAD